MNRMRIIIIWACVCMMGCAAKTAVLPLRVSVEPALPPIARVSFAFDRAELSSRAAAAVGENAAWMKAHPDTVLILSGHCDSFGSDEYNLALGDRRARAVKAVFMQQGIEAERLIIISYGEQRPITTKATKGAMRLNRRVEMQIR